MNKIKNNDENAGLLLNIPKDIENLQLPNITLLNMYRLQENRIFHINYEIDEGIYDIMEQVILINKEDEKNNIPIEERKPIKIYLNTPGGLLAPTLSLCQTLMLSKTPVYTYNLGAAYSCGLLILLAGSKRFGYNYSEALIHTGSGGTQGTYEQTVEQGKSYKRMIDYVGKYIMERTGISSTVYNKKKTKDWYLPIDEQLKYGVIHKIIDNFDELM